MAVKIYEDTMICSCCGYPTRLAHNPDFDGWFEIDDDTICFAGMARDEWEKRQEAKDKEPGSLPRIILTKNN